MKSRRARLRLAFLLALAAGPAVMFQNCARVGAPGEVTSSSVDADSYLRSVQRGFHYPYTSKPAYYAQIQLARKDGTGDFSDVAVVASVGASDGESRTFSYQIDLENENGFPICPTATGTLSGGATTVEGGCTTAVSAESITATFTVTVNGATYTFTENY